MSKTIERLEFVDALRGIAAIYVVLYHMALMPSPGLEVPEWCRVFVHTGGTGVTLFFVLSAYTLTNSLALRGTSHSEIGNFYIRRVFRVAPLFYAWILVSGIRDYLWYGVTHSWQDYLLNLTFIFNVVPGHNESLVWAGWTIGVEMIFYALFPLISRYVSDAGRALGFFFLTMLIAAAFGGFEGGTDLPEAIQTSFFKYAFLRHLPSFAAGIVCYHICHALAEREASIGHWGYALIGAAAFGYGAMITNSMSAPIELLHWQAVLYGVLLIGLSLAPMGLFVNRVTRFLGKLSYSIYLSHTTLIIFFVPAYRAIYLWEVSLNARYFAALTLTLAGVILVSWITFHAIEKVGMKMGVRVVAGRRVRAAQT